MSKPSGPEKRLRFTAPFDLYPHLDLSLVFSQRAFGDRLRAGATTGDEHSSFGV